LRTRGWSRGNFDKRWARQKGNEKGWKEGPQRGSTGEFKEEGNTERLTKKWKHATNTGNMEGEKMRQSLRIN